MWPGALWRHRWGRAPPSPEGYPFSKIQVVLRGGGTSPHLNVVHRGFPSQKHLCWWCGRGRSWAPVDVSGSSACCQLAWSCLCLCGRLSTPVHLCYLSPSYGLSNWGFRLPMRGSGYVRIAWAELHVSRCTLGSLGHGTEHVLTSYRGSACWSLVPTRFLQHQAQSTRGGVSLTTNLHLRPLPSPKQWAPPTP